MIKSKDTKENTNQSHLELHFRQFREGIIGMDTQFNSVYGQQQLLYADWIASGRLYQPIEDTVKNVIGPMVANTHSFSSETGKMSTYAYQNARQIIKDHVGAGAADVLITAGSGMTGVLARLQRVMGIRLPNGKLDKISIPVEERPVVFITHMEHHSNQVSWMETIADVVVLPCDEDKLVSAVLLEEALKEYKDRNLKIGAFTGCSNVTGIISPYYKLAKVMHRYGGYCFVDFAASAPYVDINMHPEDPEEALDAIYFSPHKFLGGPGTCGVLVFNKELYKVGCPDMPGGGNVKWTNPWGSYGYCSDIETKEDSGTPGFLQVMRAALAIRLKEKMGVNQIAKREEELLELCFDKLKKVPGLFLLGGDKEPRIGCVSFGLENIHYNLVVRLLNDRFGIQVRGGWSCASTYSHYLFDLDKKESKEIVSGITNKNLTEKPGWVRLSLHPTTTNEELSFICESILDIAKHVEEWEKDYVYNPHTNEFDYLYGTDQELIEKTKQWFLI